MSLKRWGGFQKAIESVYISVKQRGPRSSKGCRAAQKPVWFKQHISGWTEASGVTMHSESQSWRVTGCADWVWSVLEICPGLLCLNCPPFCRDHGILYFLYLLCSKCSCGLIVTLLKNWQKKCLKFGNKRLRSLNILNGRDHGAHLVESPHFMEKEKARSTQCFTQELVGGWFRSSPLIPSKVFCPRLYCI